MMLLQKPQPALSSMTTHRRQASAPVVVVQPTRIPGLLSLSKPPRSSPQRNLQRHNIKTAPKQAPTMSATVPTVVRAHARTLTPTAQIYTAPASPSPQPRGTAQDKPSKDKILRNKRSASRSPLRGSGLGKHNGRQPSPPIPSTMTTSHKQKSSQAEVPVKFANSFDPFVDHSTFTPSPSPRKQPQSSQSEAIPVPTSLTLRTRTLARSEPLPIRSNRQPRYQQHRPSLLSKRALTTQEFPICDDMSEIADHDVLSTPIPRRLYKGAPSHSAPISAHNTLEFFSPSVPLSLPSPKKNGDWARNRKHRRTPSEGAVFHMSSDEEVSSGPGGAVLNINLNPMKNLLGPFHSSAGKSDITTPARTVTSIRAGVVEGSTMTMSTSVEKATFFASSVFQNSPSPDELPDPLSI